MGISLYLSFQFPLARLTYLVFITQRGESYFHTHFTDEKNKALSNLSKGTKDGGRILGGMTLILSNSTGLMHAFSIGVLSLPREKKNILYIYI